MKRMIVLKVHVIQNFEQESSSSPLNVQFVTGQILAFAVSWVTSPSAIFLVTLLNLPSFHDGTLNATTHQAALDGSVCRTMNVEIPRAALMFTGLKIRCCDVLALFV